MAHYDETKNRFNPENRFIGDIENGKRYPFGVYTKEESDARFALKTVETTVTELAAAVAGKASQADLASLETIVAGKASAADLTALAATVASKANASDVSELANAVRALAEAVAGKADESECVDIRARLDALETDAIRINTFTVSSTSYEKGASATVSLAWSLNRAATSEKINNVTVTGTTATYTNVSNDQTYTLEVSDGTTTDSKSVSISFVNRIYYGAAADLSDITALDNVLSDDIARRFTATAGSGQYLIYAFPARLGSAQFYVDSFEGGFDSPVEQTVTNSQGYSETYKIYKSTNANLGTTTVEVREV